MDIYGDKGLFVFLDEVVMMVVEGGVGTGGCVLIDKQFFGHVYFL